MAEILKFFHKYDLYHNNSNELYFINENWFLRFSPEFDRMFK